MRYGEPGKRVHVQQGQAEIGHVRMLRGIKLCGHLWKLYLRWAQPNMEFLPSAHTR